MSRTSANRLRRTCVAGFTALALISATELRADDPPANQQAPTQYDPTQMQDAQNFVKKEIIWRAGKAALGAAAVMGLCYAAIRNAKACAWASSIGLINGAVAADDPQGQRVGSFDELPTTFSGTATDSENSLSYSGTRVGSHIEGQYSGEDGSGSFQGMLQRNGTISGGYQEGQEQGVFSGAITPTLDNAFGNAQCTEGCGD